MTANALHAADAESVEDDTEDLQLQQALAMSLEGHAGML